MEKLQNCKKNLPLNCPKNSHNDYSQILYQIQYEECEETPNISKPIVVIYIITEQPHVVIVISIYNLHI